MAKNYEINTNQLPEKTRTRTRIDITKLPHSYSLIASSASSYPIFSNAFGSLEFRSLFSIVRPGNDSKPQ